MRLRLALVFWLVAAALLVVMWAAAALDTADTAGVPPPTDAVWWWALAVVTAQAAALLRQALAPRGTLVLVAAAAPVGAALGLGPVLGITSVAVVVAAYLVVRSGPADGAWPPLAAAAGLVAVGSAWQQSDAGVGMGLAVVGGIVQGVGTVGVAALVGLAVRLRRDARSARAERTQALVREHDALVEVAVARERTAMARELHDIAAHHLSGIAVMTGAIGRQIDTDPEGAKQAVLEVRQQSREMLGDLRKLVSLLREDPADASAGVAGAFGEESLSGVQALVETARRAGADISLSVRTAADGSPPGARIGPLAQLSAYRTVQEALANASRHAPGAPCQVLLDAREPARVVVTVHNAVPRTAGDPAPTGGGFGLVGMRERAELTGAELTVGPSPDGGWTVSLAIPTLDRTNPSGEPEENR
jgi:signal transduction histidine kinase